MFPPAPLMMVTRGWDRDKVQPLEADVLEKASDRKSVV